MLYIADIQADAFDERQAFCFGCKALDKPEGVVLQNCDVRPCAREKKLESCIECDELATCDKKLWARFPKFRDKMVELQQRYRHGALIGGSPAMRRVAEDGCGVVVILRGSETPRDLVDAVERLHGRERYRIRDGRESSALRTHGIGAQILRNLGVHRMRVLSAPKQMYGLSGFGLEVVEYMD